MDLSKKRGQPVLALRSFVSRILDSEEAFTLIWLLVFGRVLALSIAIAIPQFLGARERAEDRAAQSSLRNALTAAKTAYTDQQSYGAATDVQLPAIEPSLSYVAGGAQSTGFKVVSVNVTSVSGTDQQIWSASALSKSN